LRPKDGRRADHFPFSQRRRAVFVIVEKLRKKHFPHDTCVEPDPVRTSAKRARIGWLQAELHWPASRSYGGGNGLSASAKIGLVESFGQTGCGWNAKPGLVFFGRWTRTFADGVLQMRGPCGLSSEVLGQAQDQFQAGAHSAATGI